MLHGAHHSFGPDEWDIGSISLSPSIDMSNSWWTKLLTHSLNECFFILALLSHGCSSFNFRINIIDMKCSW